ncbi:MAG: hypothetical protein E7290_02150 [Lachnospiraceae bacterium]|nr:hypothetical protein [Lachnospiraceae bacterium]
MYDTGLAHDLAMIACQNCEIDTGETVVDFSARLYETYNKCNEKILSLMQKDTPEEPFIMD